MKKLLVVLGLLVAVSGITASADYDRKDNAYQSETPSVQTVLIYKGDVIDSDSIYYVNQAESESGFGEATNFLMKKYPTDGTYYVKYNGLADPIQFTIGTASNNSADASSYFHKIGNEKTVGDGTAVQDIAFTVDGLKVDQLKNFKSIKLAYTDGGNVEMTYPISKTDLQSDLENVEANIAVGVQINNVPVKYLNSISVYLSNDPAKGEN